MLIVMVVVIRSDILHGVNRAALWTALHRSLAGGCKPYGHMAVCGRAGAADILLIAEALNDDRVVESACIMETALVCRLFVNSLLHGRSWLLTEWFLASHVPCRLASNGFMSKMSMPCILPKISRRSRPVACSRSVGMVPGCAPGGTRSCSLLISAHAY